MVLMMDQKTDRDSVERMFNKFRVILTDLNEKIENQQCSFLERVTRDELELVLLKFTAGVGDVQDSALVHASYECFVCGRKRLQVARMLIGGDPLEANGPRWRSHNQDRSREDGSRCSLTRSSCQRHRRKRSEMLWSS